MLARFHDSGRVSSFEKMEWFQALLNALWPNISGAFERDVIRGLLEPKLASKVPGLHFASAYLGDRPPELKGVRTRAMGQDVVMDFDVGFHPGNSINISLVFGPLVVAVSELSLSGHLCVTLVRLVPRKPIVCGLRIYFANSPNISFSFGGLARALPIPPQKIKEYVLEALASKVVLPNSVTVHIDSLARCWAESDFLDYHELHSIPPKAVLKVRVVSVEGPLVEALEQEGQSCLGMVTGRPPSIYALVRVGGQRSRTEPVLRERGPEGLSWAGKLHDFVVDAPADQEVFVELLSEDTSRFLQCDELLGQAKVSVQRLAGEFSAGRQLVRVTMRALGGQSRGLPPRDPRGRSARGDPDPSRSCSVVLAGAFQPLVARPPRAWPAVETLLLVSIDCVVGLAPLSHGRSFAVHMAVLPEHSHFAGRTSTSIHSAGRDQVTEARVLHTAMEEARWAAAKDRLRLLYSRGARLSPEDARYVLAGLIDKDQAAVLLEEIEREGGGEKEVAGSVEVMVGEQLRLPVGDPRCHGLRIELVDEDRQAIVGVVEWSSLAFLAQKPGMEDELQAYTLDDADAGINAFRSSDAGTDVTKVFLQRSLRILQG